MREGIELTIYNKFQELLERHEKPSYAVAHMEYMIFTEYRHEFEKLSQDEQIEVRIYMKALELLHNKK